MNATSRIAQAAAAYQRGDLDAARRACEAILSSEPRDGDATHLLGLVHKQSGDPARAESLMRASIALLPSRTEFRVNLSNLLAAAGRLGDAATELRTALGHEPDSRLARLALARILSRAGQHADAESAARRLTEANPRDAEAWSARAAAERDQGKLGAAESSYRRAIEIEPDYAVARHNLGALLGRMKRAEESLAELERAERAGVHGPEIEINKARARLELGALDAAESGLAHVAEQMPESLDAQTLLAKLRYMRGQGDFARALAAAARRSANPALALALGDLLRRAERLDEAEHVLRELAARYPLVPEIDSSLAVILQERGDLEQAYVHASRAAAARPKDPTMTENLIAILLQLGEGDTAWPHIALERSRAPDDQRWLAYQATAARLSGRPECDVLYDYERFVATYDLEPPTGYASLESFNAALATSLAAQHGLRAHPLDQSLRHGTQSTRDLRHERDAAIRGFLAAIAAPLEQFRNQIGSDAEHPFLARNRGRTELSGCWSVELHRAGYHVNHVHPEGWISSAYYVSVPAEVADRRQQSGWLKFGEPRVPVPGIAPARLVQPKPGRLVLFPSYMWHGTTPLLGDEPRLTLAFDAVSVPCRQKRARTPTA